MLVKTMLACRSIASTLALVPHRHLPTGPICHPQKDPKDLHRTLLPVSLGLRINERNRLIENNII